MNVQLHCFDQSATSRRLAMDVQQQRLYSIAFPLTFAFYNSCPENKFQSRMADPLSITASVLAVASAAVVSVRSLCDTVKSFQNRNKTLGRLHANLQDLTTILDSLVHVINADTSVLMLLEGPIDRCKNVCNEFEQSMKRFHKTSKTGLLDWTKLEFMRGDINDFIDIIDGYKSTIAVGLGTINLSVVSSSRSQTRLTPYDKASL